MDCVAKQMFFFIFYNSSPTCRGRRILAIYYVKGTVDIGAYNQGEKFCEIVLDTIEVGAKGSIKDPVYVDFTPVTEKNVKDFLNTDK